MKKLLSTIALTVCLLFSMSLMANAEEVYGLIYKKTAEAGDGSGSISSTKTGKAECTSYFGIVALGDCSITGAMRQGRISALSHYDYETRNILGFKKVVIKVYGQ